jgi:hypothetical protein
VSILYCPNNISVVMIIWKWSLAQTIVDVHSRRQLFISYNESNNPIVDDEGKIGVRKNNILFRRGSDMLDILITWCQGLKNFFPMNLFRMRIVLCCAQNCCQHSPC